MHEQRDQQLVPGSNPNPGVAEESPDAAHPGEVVQSTPVEDPSDALDVEGRVPE